MKHTLLLIYFLAASLTGLAQNMKTITGKVTDSTGEPLIGATVKVPGGSNGAITDFDGNFTIKVAVNTKKLQFSYIGFMDQTIEVKGDKVNVTMKDDTNTLDELVVIGYGAVKKGSVTAAVAKVGAEELKDRPVANVASALQGELAGVEVRSTSGAPGSEVSINVRGATSINADISSNPLFVVDGVPMDDDFDLGSLNADDIASIEVLKDASSSAIYGSRGANGVVIITSKKGTDDGKTAIYANVQFGLNQVERRMDLMSPQEWIAWRTKVNNNYYVKSRGGLGATANDDFITRYNLVGSLNPEFMNDPRWSMPNYGGLALIDWQDELFQLALYQDYKISAAAGSQKGNYRLSAGFTNQDGIIINTNMKRLNVQFTGETKVGDKLTLGLKIAPNVRWTTGGNIEGNNSAVMLSMSSVPVAEAAAGVHTGAQPNLPYQWAGSAVSGISQLEQQYYEVERVNINSSLYVNYEIIKGLQAQLLGAWNYYDNKLHRFRPSTLSTTWRTYPQEGYDSRGTWTGSSSHKMMAQALLTYNTTFGENHNLNLVAGWSLEDLNHSYSYEMDANRFPNNAVYGFTYPGENVYNVKTTYRTDDRMVSYFMRATYNYADRYLLNASIRRDGSSRFGSANRWGTFPAFSFAWRLSNEPFWPKNLAMSDAKVRISYGSNGSNALPANAADGLLSSGLYSTSNNSTITGYLPTSVENPTLTWQKTHSYDVGIDIGFLKNRFSLAIDAYVKTIKDMLYNITLPSVVGFEKGYSNIGNIENKGIELEAKANWLPKSKLTWSTTLNIAYSKSTVKDLGENSTIYCGWTNDGGYTQVIEVGKPVGEYYLYDAIGVFKNQAEVDAYPHLSTAVPGAIKYRDVNGDNQITDADRVYCGHPGPSFTYGLTNKFKWKRFDASILITAQTGGKIYGMLGRAIDSQGMKATTNTFRKYQNMWFSEDEPGDGMTPNVMISKNDGTISDNRWLFSSNFIKLKNITLGYSLPLKKNGFVKMLRITASVENLFMIDSYEGGFSPESNNSNSMTSYYDYGAYPLPRTYTLGVNMQF